jgi:hypothetical protein
VQLVWHSLCMANMISAVFCRKTNVLAIETPPDLTGAPLGAGVAVHHAVSTVGPVGYLLYGTVLSNHCGKAPASTSVHHQYSVSIDSVA